MQVYQLQCWTLRCLWGSSEGRFWSPQGMSDWCWERPMGTLQNILAHLLIHVDYFSSFSKRCGPDELNLPKRGWCASKRIDQAHWSVAVLKLCSKCLFKWCSKIVYIVAWHIKESHNYSTCLNSIDSWIIHHESYHTHTYGYGSIPHRYIFNGMNIHLPAILWFTRGTRVLTHSHIDIKSACRWSAMDCSHKPF